MSLLASTLHVPSTKVVPSPQRMVVMQWSSTRVVPSPHFVFVPPISLVHVRGEKGLPGKRRREFLFVLEGRGIYSVRLRSGRL